jgi:hypothetical protein
MVHSQDQIFSTFEGNRWFQRNSAALQNFDSQSDLPLQLMDLYGLRPRKVLEIGAANGFRLAVVHDRYESEVTAVEVSAEAIDDGSRRFPFIDFFRGVAYDIPLNEPSISLSSILYFIGSIEVIFSNP